MLQGLLYLIQGPLLTLHQDLLTCIEAPDLLQRTPGILQGPYT